MLIPLGILAQVSAAANYRLQSLGGGSSDIGFNMYVDADFNSYVVGNTASSGAGSNDIYLAKFDASGNVQWQRTLGLSASDTGRGVFATAGGDVYVSGTSANGTAANKVIVAKYNSSGTLQWQTAYGGSNPEFGEGLVVDSSGNVYATGFGSSAGPGNNSILLIKYNSSGTLQWQRFLGGTNSDQGFRVGLDSANDVYVFGRTSSSTAGGSDFLLAKYNDSGTLQWQRRLGGASDDTGSAGFVDALDNVYIGGTTQSSGAGGQDFLFAKYNTSGTIQWQRTLGTTANDLLNGVAADGSGNLYVTGSEASISPGATNLVLAKYNSSGTIEWQRTLGQSGLDLGRGIDIASTGDIYLSGQTVAAGITNILIAVLPSDGSLTGSYVLNGETFVYQASSLTSATSTLTDAAASLTSSSTSLSSSSASLTSAAATLTENRVDL